MLSGQSSSSNYSYFPFSFKVNLSLVTTAIEFVIFPGLSLSGRFLFELPLALVSRAVSPGPRNEILFDGEGKYAGFDRSAPTSASGGKPKVLKLMRSWRIKRGGERGAYGFWTCVSRCSDSVSRCLGGCSRRFGTVLHRFADGFAQVCGRCFTVFGRFFDRFWTVFHGRRLTI